MLSSSLRNFRVKNIFQLMGCHGTLTLLPMENFTLTLPPDVYFRVTDITWKNLNILLETTNTNLPLYMCRTYWLRCMRTWSGLLGITWSTSMRWTCQANMFYHQICRQVADALWVPKKSLTLFVVSGSLAQKQSPAEAPAGSRLIAHCLSANSHPPTLVNFSYCKKYIK